MINSKKIVTLCATTLTGLTILGSVAPISAFADVAAHSGETSVRYSVATWGLSVPSEVSVDKTGDMDGTSGTYGGGEVKIVNQDGTDREPGEADSDAEYEIVGTPSSNQLGTKDLYYKTSLQGEAATDWASTSELTTGQLAPATPLQVILRGADGALKMNALFGIKDSDAGTVKEGDSMKISWTATRDV